MYTDKWETIAVDENGNSITYDMKIPSGYRQIRLRARLLVSQDGWSDYATATININSAPSTPAAITIPETIYGGKSITVSWTASIDMDGNLAGYAVEQSTDGGATWTQIYQGGSTSTTITVPFGTQSVMYRVRAYDSERLYSGYRNSAKVNVINNSAPTTPAAITIPETIYGGKSITVSWTASTDGQGNLEGYAVEQSTDGGTTWTQIYQGGSTSTTITVPFGTQSVMYRVRAYDSERLYSGYRNSAQVNVINNTAPAAPGSITVPEAVSGGGAVEISWTASIDGENNLAGYCLERQVDGGDWAAVYSGPEQSFTDQITKGWQTVAYRVRAYDSHNAYSGFAVSETRTVNNNTPPAIVCEYPANTPLGVKNEGFDIPYSVTDEEEDEVTVTEAVDGTALRAFTARLEAENSFTLGGVDFMKLLNGAHTLVITASDGKASAVHRLPFTKKVTGASVTLEQPMTADAPISVCVLSVTGSIPTDAQYSVKVTNNANDAAPVWEDCTAAVRIGANHIFANQTAVNGFTFNFKVEVERGASGVGGYISSIQGGFQ